MCFQSHYLHQFWVACSLTVTLQLLSKHCRKIFMIPCKILRSLPCPVGITPVIIDGNSATAYVCCISHTTRTAHGSCQLSCPVVLNTLQRLLYGTNPWLSLAAEFQILKNETLVDGSCLMKGINTADSTRMHVIIQINSLRQLNAIAILFWSHVPPQSCPNIIHFCWPGQGSCEFKFSFWQWLSALRTLNGKKS